MFHSHPAQPHGTEQCCRAVCPPVLAQQTFRKSRWPTERAKPWLQPTLTLASFILPETEHCGRPSSFWNTERRQAFSRRGPRVIQPARNVLRGNSSRTLYQELPPSMTAAIAFCDRFPAIYRKDRLQEIGKA